ncbi:hypothetical protein EVC27_006 [Rhizobium phage RHph_I1_6]|uniref:Uncharacterized protein n=1 Tax=Rhizobium phage RHph_I1_6 TaxID=2509728 RepID=A0A7S5RIT5_9CAUD|nr:hypothetical protein PP745_gp006 [Rhizobium phage RHph_I1_6]QIG76531.1 hypothetical protein EVC27_006 [Rhizobium phage RHph_I1_6]
MSTNWHQRSYDDGRKANREGLSIDDNPFDIDNKEEWFFHDSWQEGWIYESNRSNRQR